MTEYNQDSLALKKIDQLIRQNEIRYWFKTLTANINPKCVFSVRGTDIN